MKYYHLREELFEGRWHIGDIQGVDGSNPSFLDSEHLPDIEYTSAIVPDGFRTDFTVTSFGVPVLHPQVAKTLFQILPIKAQLLSLSLDDGTPMTILNTLCEAECLNEADSDFIKWTSQDHRPDREGEYRQVTKLRLHEDKIDPSWMMFRVRGWPAALVVSEAFRDVAEMLGVTGTKFIPLFE
ncbi:MAG: hypothetical protein NTY98_09660 [Verrucomicrobia bacterium]|nr:hypothetical protein [Verrucomicrobiota bacterium]